MGAQLAAHLPPVRHHPQLQQAPLGELLHGHLHHRHAVDRRLLLPDGVAGEWQRSRGRDSPCLAPVGDGRAGFQSGLGHCCATCGKSPTSLTSAYFSVERDFGRSTCHCAMCQGGPGGHGVVRVCKAGMGAAAWWDGQTDTTGEMWALCEAPWRVVTRPPSFPGSPGECEGDRSQWEMNTRQPFLGILPRDAPLPFLYWGSCVNFI